MKKLLALLTILAVLFCFAACGDEDKKSDKKNDKEVTEVTDTDDTADEPSTSVEATSDDIKTAKEDIEALKALGYSAEYTDSNDNIAALLEFLGIKASGVKLVICVDDPNGIDGAYFFYCADAASAATLGTALEEFVSERLTEKNSRVDITQYLAGADENLAFFGHQDIFAAIANS